MTFKILNSLMKYSPLLRDHVSLLCGNIDEVMLYQLLSVVKHLFQKKPTSITIGKNISRANQVFSCSDSVPALKILLKFEYYFRFCKFLAVGLCNLLSQ